MAAKGEVVEQRAKKKAKIRNDKGKCWTAQEDVTLLEQWELLGEEVS